MPGFPLHPGVFMPPGYHAMMGAIPGMPYAFPAAFPFPTPMHQVYPPPSQNVVTEQDFVKMIQRHGKRRSQDEVQTK